MALYLRKAEKLIDDLLDCRDIVCLVYQGENHIGGLQSDNEGHNIRIKLVNSAIALSKNRIIIVTPENHLKMFGTITEPKCITLIHYLNDAENQLLILNDFFKKNLIFEHRISKGLEAIPPTIPPLYKDVMSCNTLQDTVNMLTKYCRFISIWPAYWGVLGEHCFIASQNIEAVINTLPAMLELNEPLKYIDDADMAALGWIG
jgi:hypothetical protein